MSKKTQLKLNIGLSSILLIFVVLCLVSFAILSLVSSNADKILSLKMLERNTTYYNACNQFEADCALLYDSLSNAYSNSIDANDYYHLLGESNHTYVYTLSDLQTLEITVEYIYPPSSGGALYKILSRKVVTNENIEFDTHLNVIP